MSIIEQTLRRLDGDAPPGPLQSEAIHASAVFERRPRRTPIVLAVLAALGLAGAGAWFAWTGMVSPGAVATVSKPPVPPVSSMPSSPIPAPSPAAAVEQVRPDPAPAARAPGVGPTGFEGALPAPHAGPARAERAAAGWIDEAAPWVRRGAEQYIAGQRDDAFAIWRESLAGIPAHHLLLNVAQYSDASLARRTFEEMAGQFPVFLVKGRGARLHLLAYLNGERNDRMRDGIAHQLGNDAPGWVSAAGFRAGTLQPSPRFRPDADEAPAARPQGRPVAQAAGSSTRTLAAAAAAGQRGQASERAADPAAGRAGPAQEQAGDERAGDALRQAQALIDGRQHVEALFMLRSAPADARERWTFHYLVGVAEMGLGRREQAMAALGEAIRIAPHQPQPWVQRAVLQQERKDHNAALADLRRAAEISPRLPEIHLNAGYSADALGRTKEARDAYVRFLDLSASRAHFHESRQWVARRLRDLGVDGNGS